MQYTKVQTTHGVAVAYHVGIAATVINRCIGLLGRGELPLDHGLLLRPGGSIHTVGMRFAIDALFLDSHLRILSITHRLRPNRIRIAPPGTRAVLELSAGRAQACALQPGMALILPQGTTP